MMKPYMRNIICQFTSIPLSADALAPSVEGTHSCTTILVGKAATMDGSVLMATSCDGNIMGHVYVLPAKEYPKDAKVRMFYDFPAPSTWEERPGRNMRNNCRKDIPSSDIYQSNRPTVAFLLRATWPTA